MEIWVNELDKRMNKKDELEQSAQHKDWLVKYYGSLCEIATSGKQMGNKWCCQDFLYFWWSQLMLLSAENLLNNKLNTKTINFSLQIIK